MNETYRLKRSSLYVALGGFVFGVVLFGVLIAGILVPRAAANPPLPLWLVGAFVFILAIPLFFVMVSAYLLLAYFRHKLVVRDDSVEYIGVVTTRRVALTKVTAVRWRLFGTSGRLVLKTPTEKVRIDFADYSRVQAQTLIRFFRLRLPEAVQKNWEKFWTFYWPIFDEPDKSSDEYIAARKRFRTRIDVLFLISTLVIVPSAVLVSWWTGDRDCLRQLVILFFLWPLVRLCQPAKGKTAKQVPSSPQANAALIIAVVVLVLTLTLTLTLVALDIAVGRPIFFAGIILSLVLLFLGVMLQNSRLQHAKKEGAKIAEQEFIYQSATHSQDQSPR